MDKRVLRKGLGESMAKFTCPFCINEYSKSKVLYICPDCGEVTAPKTFERGPVKCKAKSCGGLATVRKCPSCPQVIPKTALETPNLPFSIVGVSNSGKTNYITVMLHELGRSSGLRIALGHQTKETLDRQKDNYRRIYEEHTRPESTPSGEPLPQIWYVKNLQRKKGSNVPTYTFTIFDGAGEDHEQNLDPSSNPQDLQEKLKIYRYIKSSKAIILTIDPLILSEVRKDLDDKVVENSLGGHEGETKNAEDVINSVAGFIKVARDIDSKKLLYLPVAVVLTKFDTILNHESFGPNARIRDKSRCISSGVVNMTEIAEVDKEIRKWLEKIRAGSFIEALESHFNEFCFFGVSSYGDTPKDKYSLPDDIRPHRVLDPILWLFKKAKFVD